MGIFDLGAGREEVRKIETTVFLGRYMSSGDFKTELHKISVERGMSWESALELFAEHKGKDDGFYVSTTTNLRKTVILVVATGKKRLESGEKLYNIYRPNTGLNMNRVETIEGVKRRFKKVTHEEANDMWTEHYDSSLTTCQHAFWASRCRNVDAGFPCEVGKRKRFYFVLAGSVLNVWHVVESVLATAGGRHSSRLQVIRSRTKDGQKIVGVLIPTGCKNLLVERLSEQAIRTYIEAHIDEDDDEPLSATDVKT